MGGARQLHIGRARCRGFQPSRSTNPSSHESASPRPQRTFILAIDEHSLHVSNALAAVNAAERFIDRLQPDDLVGLQAYPTGSAHHDLTTDHAAVRLAVGKITGLFQEPSSRFRLTLSEAIDIASGGRDSMMGVMKRECPSMRCDENEIRNEAISLAGSIEMRVSQSVGGLRGLVRSVENIPGRKTSPDAALERVLRETSAHYLLGVEAGTADRDGQARVIRVSVKRDGAQVRSRTTVMMPRAGSQMK